MLLAMPHPMLVGTPVAVLQEICDVAQVMHNSLKQGLCEGTNFQETRAGSKFYVMLYVEQSASADSLFSLTYFYLVGIFFDIPGFPCNVGGSSVAVKFFPPRTGVLSYPS